MAGAVCVALVALGTSPAHAAPGDPPYTDQLLRLAEIMGALHYLRPLCGANEEQIWRQKMSQLLAAEEASQDERRRLIDRFNQSYRSLSEVHRACTPATAEIVDLYLVEGGQLSREIVTRFGPR